MDAKTRTITAIAVVGVVAIAGTATYLLLVPVPSTSTGPPGSISEEALCPSVPQNASGGNWTTYHADNGRGGYQASAPLASARPSWSRPTMLDGDVYAEPLVCGGAVFVATEDDSVYAINASSGAILWRTHLGTPVPGDTLPCGDIDPSGITGTPVIDTATGTLYAVAFLLPAEHVLFGLNVTNGSIRSQVPVDPSGALPQAEQQRGALALANGRVYIPYGGLYGDCAQYHGWVVGVPLNGSGPLEAYQVPTHREGGIWSPAGIAVASNGSLYVATGNGDSTTTFDFGDSVIELTPALEEVDYFAPTNWADLNAQDMDLGTVAPTLLPNGEVFQVGKAGVGYLLAEDHLGGIGGQLGEGNVCGGAYAGTAHVGLSVLVACVDGLFDVEVRANNFTVAWHSASFDAGAPVVTGGVVWVVNTGTADLIGLNLTTGAPFASFPLGGADHFISPAAAPGRVYVGAGDALYSFTLASANP